MYNIIGISALYHDSACCLLQDGELKAAALEERFTRIKHDDSIPYNAFMYCLEEGGLSINDIKCIAYYEDPEKKLARQLWSGIHNLSDELIFNSGSYKVEKKIREILGYEGPIKFIDHHKSHSASTFFFSGFKEAAIMTIDGVGEWTTTTYGIGKNKKINIFEEVSFPDSIGLLYSTITNYLGFEVNEGEYKVMGLAPYGKPSYVNHISKLIEIHSKGQYKLNLEYFDFLRGKRMFSDKLFELLGKAARQPDTELLQFHKDVARSLQIVLEETLLKKIQYLHEIARVENLCLAGGVALNCVANRYLLKNGPFKRLFVQPAANDSGGALGAAAEVYAQLSDDQADIKKLEHVYLGPSYTNTQIKKITAASSIKIIDFSEDQNSLIKAAAQRLAEGKVIGWFQGRMEFGPRALGARSILADPRDPGMKDRINALVKMREGFRPFAPVVLEHKAAEHFDLDHSSPFMLETCSVKSHINLPAITHIDNSARVQTVNQNTNSKLFELISAFEKLTSCPILLNTSFNIKGQPIVCTPTDAIKCFITTNIDCLVMEDILIDRSESSLETLEYIINQYEKTQSGIKHDVYTFI